jgi:hypothetical protein
MGPARSTTARRSRPWLLVGFVAAPPSVADLRKKETPAEEAKEKKAKKHKKAAEGSAAEEKKETPAQEAKEKKAKAEPAN